MKKKFAVALSAARVMPTTRAHVCPDNSAQPAKATTRPSTRWIQPQAETSNWNR
jgi:hypothetical protein